MGIFDGVLLVSDFDDTLVDRKKRLPERTKTALSRFVAQGGKFTLASGRGLESVQKQAPGLPIGAPVIVASGMGHLAEKIVEVATDNGVPVYEDTSLATVLSQMQLGREIPVLGVCLGHQAICQAFGASITYARQLMHGKQSLVHFDTTCPLFAGCPEQAPVARYHSLAADPDTIPDCLKVTASTADHEVMAVQHREFPIYGVQFHPESIMTPGGKAMLENFIKEI